MSGPAAMTAGDGPPPGPPAAMTTTVTIGTTTVAVVAASWLTRIGVAQVLGRTPRLRVTATVATPDELAPPGPGPDLIIWDQASHPAEDPARVIAVLAGQAPVLVITGPGPADGLLALLLAGACGLITGHSSDTEFLSAVEATARGAVYLAAGLAGQLGSELSRQRQACGGPLSRREIETLRLIADGYTHRQAARKLGLTEETVNTYVKRIRGKLSAGNKAELTRKAIDLGYITTARQQASPPESGLAGGQPFRRPA